MAHSIVAGDPSLRLKNGCAQDDAIDDERRCHQKFKLSHYLGAPFLAFFAGGEETRATKLRLSVPRQFQSDG